MRAPPYKYYRRNKKTQASLWLEDHCLVLDQDYGEDPPMYLDSGNDQQLDLV